MPSKKTRERWNKTEVNTAFVNAWKENLIDSTQCNEGWGKVKDAAAKHGHEKTVKQCKNKI